MSEERPREEWLPEILAGIRDSIESIIINKAKVEESE